MIVSTSIIIQGSGGIGGFEVSAAFLVRRSLGQASFACRITWHLFAFGFFELY